MHIVARTPHTHTKRSGNDSFLLHFCSSKFPFLCAFCHRFLVSFWLIRYCSCLRVLLSVFLVGLKCVLLLYIPSIQVYLLNTKFIERIPLQYLRCSCSCCCCCWLLSFFGLFLFSILIRSSFFHLGYLVHLQ